MAKRSRIVLTKEKERLRTSGPCGNAMTVSALSGSRNTRSTTLGIAEVLGGLEVQYRY